MSRHDEMRAARAAYDSAWEVFLRLCHAHGYRNEWEAYRALVDGAVWLPQLGAAHDLAISHLHRFYRLRDGESGFLGRK